MAGEATKRVREQIQAAFETARNLGPTADARPLTKILSVQRSTLVHALQVSMVTADRRTTQEKMEALVAEIPLGQFPELRRFKAQFGYTAGRTYNVGTLSTRPFEEESHELIQEALEQLAKIGARARLEKRHDATE